MKTSLIVEKTKSNLCNFFFFLIEHFFLLYYSYSNNIGINNHPYNFYYRYKFRYDLLKIFNRILIKVCKPKKNLNTLY